MIRFLICVALFTVLFNNLSNAQQIRVFGSNSGQPVENAALYSQDKRVAVLTDEKGRASLDMFADDDSVCFQHPSFMPICYALHDLADMQEVGLDRKNIMMDEFVIAATKSRENKRNVAYQVEVLETKELKSHSYFNASEILTLSGTVALQQSQANGGSPIIRGFEANRILLVLDGVRLNNAIYRSGHLQNSMTIDNNSLDRVEVIHGPGSIIYGSDALGGVVHYFTKDPVLSQEPGNTAFKIDAFSQYSTVNKGFKNSIGINAGGKEFGSYSSFTWSKTENYKMGKNENPFYGNFSKNEHFVVRVNGKDTMLANTNPHEQLFTGFEQFDVVQKFLYSPSSNLDLTANFQYSNSANLHRNEMLNDYDDEGNLEYAEWYYGPQERFFASLKATLKNPNRVFNSGNIILAYQNIDESRMSRQYKAYERLNQLEHVEAYSLNADMYKESRNGIKVNYGLENVINTVLSDGFYQHIATGEKTTYYSRYPDGNNYTLSSAGYAHVQKQFLDNKWVANAGTRFSYNYVHLNYHNLDYSGGLNSVDIENTALTGMLSLVYHPNKSWKADVIFSTGYRMPNVDDLGKVRVRADNITLPNVDLKPEYAYNAELGLEKTLHGHIKLSGTAFLTLLDNAIVRDHIQFNGRDSIEYDHNTYYILSNTNVQQAIIGGVSGTVVGHFSQNFHVKSSLNFTVGEDLMNNEPLGHIPPVFGRTDINYTDDAFAGTLYMIYNGWKRLQDMSPFGEDKEDEATDYGFPGWYTINARINYEFTPQVSFGIAIENILDSFYKPYASAIAGRGRNFIFTIKAYI